jgi:hypothetical protein
MVRIDPDDADDLLAAGARPMEMRGRPMRGWLRVDADRVETDQQLAGWVRTGADVVRSLPPEARPAR